jgi:hypothetical protein
MVTLLYAVAGLLLILTIVADSPFTKTYLVVFATASFLLARFIRIERRLDRIEGIQRSPRLKRAASWAWSNKELFIFVGSLAFLAGYVSWFWGGITDSLSTLSPKRPHPWLDAILGSNHVLTILLVWFPIGAFFTFLFLAAIVGDILAVAILLGFSPRSNRQKTSARSGASGWAKIVEWLAEWGLGVFACWILFVMIYAKKESGAFFSLFDQL